MSNRYSPGALCRFLFYCMLCNAFFLTASAQTPIFIETFGNTAPGACDQGTHANGFVSAVGTWTVTTNSGNDSAANEWYISAAESGEPFGSCSAPGCFADPTKTNRTLHVGNVSNS